MFLLINCDRWYAITTSNHVPCFAEVLNFEKGIKLGYAIAYMEEKSTGIITAG